MSRLHPISIEVEIPFHDVDLLGVAWHGHYYKYMELGRTALMRHRALDVSELRALGYRLLVVESQCRHTGSARYGERIEVQSWFARLPNDEDRTRFTVGYRLRNLSREAPAPVARAKTTLVVTDSAGTMLKEVPDAIVQRLLG